VSERFRSWLIGVFFPIGFYVGYWLSSIPELRSAKLLNLVGLLYAFLGVLVLSEIFATKQWKDFCVLWLAPTILIIHSLIPIGAIFGSLFAIFLHRPSSFLILFFSLFFGGCSGFVGIFFDEIVVSPSLPFVGIDIDLRWRWLGLFLVLGGVGTQLIAAVLDLNP
jgi:hypothetical protein